MGTVGDEEIQLDVEMAEISTETNRINVRIVFIQFSKMNISHQSQSHQLIDHNRSRIVVSFQPKEKSNQIKCDDQKGYSTGR